MSQLVTGEAVVLQVRIARMPTRALACAIDVALQGARPGHHNGFKIELGARTVGDALMIAGQRA